jgi:hypothetical protein
MSCPNYDEAIKEVADGIREVIYTRISAFSVQQESENKNLTLAKSLSGRLPNYDTLVSEIRISPQNIPRFSEEVGQSFKPVFTKTIKILKLIDSIGPDDDQQ